MQGVPVCRICKDPVWSYICPDCLAKDIKKWLPNTLRARFSAFSKAFVEHFGSGHGSNPRIYCIKCRKKSPANICPFCYVTEIHEWLIENGQAELAQTLAGMLPMDHGWKGQSEHSARFWKDSIYPITQTETREYDEGICEECGEFSDKLEQVNGEWICRSCKSWQ